MYPTLAPVGKSSHWYTEKQTIREKAQEITELEDKMEAKRLNDIQVGIPILIRGQPIQPSKILSINGDKDEEEEEPIEEEIVDVDDDGLDEREPSGSHLSTDNDDFHNHMYEQQQQHQDDDEDDGIQPQTFHHARYDSDDSL